MPPKSSEDKCYAAPNGWQFLFAVPTDRKQVKASTRTTNIISGTCAMIWRKYTETRPSRRQLRELQLAVNPHWLADAMKSDEVRANIHTICPQYSPDIHLGGIKVRKDATVPTNAIYVEEKLE